MIIAVSAGKHEPDPVVSSHFGRSSCFVMVDTNNESREVVENPYADMLGDGGIQSAQLLIQRNVDAVITCRIGRNALRILSAANVRIYRCPEKGAKEAIDLFVDGKLEQVSLPGAVTRRRQRRRHRRSN